MKKFGKTFLLLLIIIIVWGALFVVDFLRFKKGLKPLIIVNTVHYDYADGYINEYYSLGYKLIEYDRDFLKNTTLAPFFSKKVDENAKYTFVDETTNCENKTSYFYEDFKYKYYFECDKKIYLKYNDGSKVELAKALENKLTTIEKFEKSKIEFKKREIKELNFEVSYVGNCSYTFNKDEHYKKLNVNEPNTYLFCLKNVNVIIEHISYNIEDALNQKKVTANDIIDSMDIVTTYGEDGATLYETTNLRVLECPNKSLVFGNSTMENFSIFCK